MLFHSPFASSSCPFTVKWKQSAVKKLTSIFPSWVYRNNSFVWVYWHINTFWSENSCCFFSKCDIKLKEEKEKCMLVVAGDLQGVLAAVRPLNKVAEQQQSPFWRNDRCPEASLISSIKIGSEHVRTFTTW